MYASRVMSQSQWEGLPADGRHDSRCRELRDHIFNYKHETEEIRKIRIKL